MTMTGHVYPTAAMLGDYARTAAGLVPAAAILATAPIGAVGATMLGGVAAFFALFGIRTALRHGTLIELSETALQARGLVRASISWSELDRLKLAYYSTRRDGRGGWMQLELRSGRSALRVDSRIEGFSRLVEVAARGAERRGLSLDPATAANLQALGVKLPAVEIGVPKTARGAA
jgi:hypothetical protein